MQRKSLWKAAFRRTLVVRGYDEYSSKIALPVKIALVTDLHSTRYGERQQKLLRAIRKYRPDLILMAGDIADDVVPLEGTRQFLAGLGTCLAHSAARGGGTESPGIAGGCSKGSNPSGGSRATSRCFFVTGNHEQRTGKLEAIKKMFTAYGVTVLSGETRTVDVCGQLLDIGGVDDPTVFTRSRFVKQIPARWERQLDACRAKLTTGRYSILLSHRPELTRRYRASSFDLVLAGHAHGGQVRLPGLVNGLLAPHQGFFPRYAGGRYRLGPTTMIVSRGLCLNHLPRIFNPPELVMIHLLPAPDES